MKGLNISWRKITQAEQLRRSSQVLAVHGSKVLLFGGEIQPRQPVDTQVQVIDVETSEITILKPSYSSTAASNGPAARVGAGAATSTANGTTYIFSGRGGVAMNPLDEPEHNASIWALSLPKPTGNKTSSSSSPSSSSSSSPSSSSPLTASTSFSSTPTWSLLSPRNPSAPFPLPRSYHAMVSDSRDAVYLHGGCSPDAPDGARLADLWVFQPTALRWTALAEAPGAPRGGSALAHCPTTDRLFRFGGFDGRTEVGGSMDVYDPERDCWSEVRFEPDGLAGPKPRSVCALVPARVAHRAVLVTLFGEGEPSNKGHAGAGRMFGDVWAWDIKNETWSEVGVVEGEEGPCPRGWFAAAAMGDDGVVVQGGLGEDNQRLDDLWLGKLEVAEE